MRPTHVLPLFLVVLACSGEAGTDLDAAAHRSDASVSSDAGSPDGSTDADVGALMLHGGGPEDHAIFARFVAEAGHGHIVTLGAVGDPEYPDLHFWDGYFESLGAASAETVDAADAEPATITAAAEALGRADGIFIRGGDQERYLSLWRGTAIEQQLRAAHRRGAILGGSSAGAMVLGSPIHPGGATSYEALADAYDPYVTFEPGLVDALDDVLVDTHFTERGRIGRAVVFAVRAPFSTDGPPPIVVGVDPRTAVFVGSDGALEVVGRGSVTVLTGPGEPALAPGRPPEIEALGLWQLTAGYRADLGALRAGGGGILERPSYVEAIDTPAELGPLSERSIAGDDLAGRALGDVAIEGLDADPYAWRDRELSLGDGDGALPGAVVMSRLFDDSTYFENHVGGLVWALAENPGLVALGVDLGTTGHTAPPSTVWASEGGYVLVLDSRTATHAGVPPQGWLTAALEGVTLRVVGTTPWGGGL